MHATRPADLLFLRWARSYGVRWCCCNEWPAYDSESASRGVRACQPIARGQELFAIPASIMLTPAHLVEVGGSRHCSSSSSKWQDMDTALALAIVLLHEALVGKESSWWPWLATLPTSFPHALWRWGDQDIASLQEPEMLAIAREHTTRMSMAARAMEEVLLGRLQLLRPRAAESLDSSCACACAGCESWCKQPNSNCKATDNAQHIANVERLLAHLHEECGMDTCSHQEDAAGAAMSHLPETWFSWVWHTVCSRGWNHPSQVVVVGNK